MRTVARGLNFQKILTKLTNDFAAEAGVKKNDVYWQEVEDSDWCKRMIIIYAKVGKDWKPTKETTVYDESFDSKWYPNLAKDLSSWIYGGGRNVNIEKDPPKNPHSLFRTIAKKS